MDSIYKITDDARNSGQPVALCTITQTKGSTPLKTGAKMLVYENGHIAGSIGGGALEKKTIEHALQVIQTHENTVFTHNLLQELGMCCGGTVEIFIEYIPPQQKLYIFGAGHVGRALAEVASFSGFEVFLIDERKNELDKISNESVFKLPYHFSEILESLPFTPYTYIAILTYDHKTDRDILAACIHRTYAYLGMIGSKRKVEVTRKLFLGGRIATEEQINKVDMPMGFDLLSNKPEEIAIAIIARIIEIKNKQQKPVSSSSKKINS